MGYYLIIRGPLGVGKTTISRTLANSLDAKVVSIDEIVDKDWDGGSVRLFVRANRVVAARAREDLARGRRVGFDGCFYWRPQITDLERRLPFAHRVFTLKAPLSVCIERDSGRRTSYGAEATQQVYRKGTRFERGIPIDASRDIDLTVRQIRSHLPPAGAVSQSAWTEQPKG